jgi:hypothetical protein
MRNIVLQKHQNRLLKYAYKNVITDSSEGEGNIKSLEWNKLLRTIGSFKKMVNQANNNASDSMVLRSLLSDKQFESLKTNTNDKNISFFLNV